MDNVLYGENNLMPKQVHEIKSFNQGTHITPADADIPENAADYSLNIDPMSKDGVLRGMNKDLRKHYRDSGDTVRSTFDGAQANGASTLDLVNATAFNSSGNIVFTDSKGYVQYLSYSGKVSNQLTGVSNWRSNQGTVLDGNVCYMVAAVDAFVSHSSGIINDNNTRHLVYFDDTDDKIKKIEYLYSEDNQAAPLLRDASSTAESFTGLPSMIPNNKEVHIGMGDGANDKPLWCGVIGHGQFGASASSDLKLTDAELSPPSTLPPFDKTIRIGSYLYGAQDGDTKVYAVTLTTGKYYNDSFDIFSSIVSIAYHDANTFWVLDKVSSTVAELKLVDASSFEVTQTSTITGIQNHLPSGSNTNTAFATWFDSSTIAGGADFITDLIETSGKIWYLRGCGIEDDSPSTLMIKKRFLFRTDIPTTTGDLTIYDVSPMLEANANVSYAVEGYYYKSYDAGTTATLDDSVMAQIPYKGLIDCGAAVGFVCSIHIDDGSSGPLSIYWNNGSTNGYAALRNSAASDGLYPLLYIFHDTKWQNSGSYTQNPIDVSTGDDQNSAKIRRISWGSATTDYLNKVISSASYDGVSGSATGVTFHDSDSDSDMIKTQIALQAGTDYVWSADDAFEGSISLDNNDHPDYEMRSACITAVDDGTGSTVYIARGSKGLDTNKHQLIRSVATAADGSSTAVTYFNEADLSVGFSETGTDAIWPADTSKIFYKMSYTYDGYQESPLSNVFLHPISAATKRLRLDINVHNLSSLSPRVSHLNIYSASSTNSGAQGADGFYRLVTSLKMDSSFTSSSSDENGSLAPAWGDIRTREYLDNGKATSSYEARTGLNEVIKNTIPNYGISTSLNNQLFVARCSHEDIDDAGNYLFKSRPYNFDQFNWAQDFLVLPTYPTAMTSFNGRIYIFDENNTYRIEPNNLYIEDVLEGVGCFSQRSISVTDYGMCFADRNNVYLHNGKQAQPISININGNLSDSYAWHTIDKDWNPIIRFYNKYKSFLVFFKASDGKYRIWSFNTIKRRWDLWEWGELNGSSILTSEPTDVIVGKNGEINISSNNRWWYLWEDESNQRKWDWQSKKITLGQDTQIKRFNDFHVTGSPSGTLGNTTSGIYLKVDGSNVTESGTLNTFVIDTKSGKYLRWFLAGQTGEVDALGTVYRRKIVTAEQ
tara:strand:- start:6091 stop:9576 length:3486 start_codon:yes stop_codon:yes gene_type:complete